MIVEIKLFAHFRDGRFRQEKRECPDQTTVAQIIADLDIRLEEVGVTMINGRHCRSQDELQHNDSLGIFPMIGGG